MNALLAALSLALVVIITLVAPKNAAGALLVCGVLGVCAGSLVGRAREDRRFLLYIFVGGLLVRAVIATLIFSFDLQTFFGGDAFTYDFLGSQLLDSWRTGAPFVTGDGVTFDVGWGMAYFVASIYYAVGRNMLAVQLANSVLGAATAPVIYLCAQRIFANRRVSRTSAFFVAFYPSLVLWSSQGLKDGPMVFLLALAVMAALKLGERFSAKHIFALVAALAGILSLRFYVFYMMVAAVGGAFVIGMKAVTAQSFARQIAIVAAVGLALTYLGVLRGAGETLGRYGNLQAVQVARGDLANSANSGFGRDVDVSTTSGALSTIPIGLVYLLFAPFPWQLASLRQTITLPEMVMWWASFPLLCTGLWFTLRHRMRQALPVLIFTLMLTLAYSVFQGNIGTAYRQRSQLLIFYFMFVSVGYELARERRHDRAKPDAALAPALVPHYDACGPRRVAGAQAREAFVVPPLAGASRYALGPGAADERARAKREMYAAVREDFLSCPGATEADFERLWPSIRDEIFTRGAYRALARRSPHFAQSLPDADAHAVALGEGDAPRRRGEVGLADQS